MADLDEALAGAHLVCRTVLLDAGFQGHAYGLLLDPRQESFGHPKLDVSFEQAQAHLAQGRANVAFVKLGQPREAVACLTESACNRVEHVNIRV